VHWVRGTALLAVGGVALWASGTDGGLPARAGDLWDWVQGEVDAATADPQLRRAEEVMDAWYERTGSYPDRSDFDPDDPTYELPVGLSISYCGPRHVVLSALTARGTVSRLLVDGQRVGDVTGAPDCPPDPDAPAPW
jgi:hypothetical protein